MESQKDNVSKLYQGLLKNGYTQDELGDEAKFRQRMSNVNNRKMFYDYAVDRGDRLIGDYDTYMSKLDEAYAQPTPEENSEFEANAERFRNGKPIERVTTQSVIDANPELGSQQPVITPYSIERASLKEQVASNSRKFPKMGDLPWAKPQGGTDGYVHTTDLSERLNRTYQDGGMESFLHSEEDEKIKAQYTPKEEKTTADVWGNAMNKFALTERGGQLQSELAQIQDEITNKYLEEFKDSDEYKQFLDKKYATKDEEYKANKAVNDLFNAKYAEAISNDMQPYMQAYNNEVMHRYGVDVESGLNNIAKKEAAETLGNLSTSVNADLEKIEDEITSRQKAVRNIDWKPGMPSSRDDAKLSELRGQRTYLEGAKELIEDSQNILNAVEAEKDGSFFGGLGRGIRDKAFDIDTWTMGLSDLVGGLRLKSVLEKAEKGENLTPAEEKLLDASVNNMAVNFYYRNDLGLGYQAGEITGQSIPFMLEFLVNPVSASGNAMAKRLLTYGLKRFGSAVNSKAIKAGTRLATDALAAGGVTATTGMGHVLSGGVERLNRNYEYGLDEEGNLNVVNTHNMGVGEAFAKSATSAFLERQSEMIFNAFRGAPSLFKGIETSLPGGVNTFMNYVSNSRLGELWRGIKNNATMKELAKRTQFHGLGEEYLEEVYNNFANIPLGEMTFEEATDLENNIVTFLGLAPTQVMFSAIGGIGYGVERYKAKRDLERTFGKMTEEQKRKLIELQEMGKLSTNKDIAFFLAETIKDESLTPEQKRAEIEYAYNLAKQNAIDEVSNTDVEDSIESENVAIDAVTNLSTGEYIEVDRWVVDAETGVRVPQPGNIVGWIGEAPVFVPEGMENTEENRIVLKPNEWNPETIQRRPAEEVKAISEEMIREEAAQQAEQEAKYAPEVINAQMQQGVPFDTPNAQIVPVAPMPEGNGWIVEEYALDTNNKVAKTPIVRELTNDEYRDMLQAQLNAEEAAQEQIAAEEQETSPEVVEEAQPTEEADVKENFTTETGNNLSPVEEVAQPQVEVKPQTPVIPTKEDGSIDFVSYGKEGTFKTLGEKYGEKMPNKVAVTAKALSEDLKKAQKILQKAEEAYDNAPIGREQKAEEARDQARQELEAIQREANFWAEMDAEIKDAQARRESMLNPQAEVETSTEPMNVDEFVAQQLASGNIVLDKEDYKKETGYGDTEANAMNGGATKLFGKNGMTIQEAGERLMEIDRENGTNFFDQLDSNSGRDALINVLGSVKSRNELNQYIATNRAEQAKRESEGLRNELEKQAMEANYASLEDYVLQMEVEEMENPFLNDRADEIMAIFAEEAAKYEQSLNNTENGQGTENEVVEGNDSILPEEQLDNTGRTEVSEESERIGDGTSEESESTHAATEVELKQEEGETTLQFAERAAEENRRRPLRKRAEEWSNTLGVKVTYLESIDDVDAKTRSQIEAAHAKGSSVPGWVNKKGEVFFFMPDLSDLKDVDDTYIHEVVAHVGLPQLLGKERFGELCDKVWEMMPQSAKDYYMSYPGVKNHRDAADEYIAHLAEQQNLTPEERTIWDNIVKMFREMLDKALNGIISKSKLTDEDISNLIKASYANLKSGAEGNVSGESTKFRAKWRKGQLDKASRTIRRWLENNTRGKSFEIELPKATLDKVRKAMGRDFESHNITSNGIVHALKNHGENGLKLTGISIPLSKEDVELIPYIMTSPDRVEKASTDASGRESVRFYKDLSNGYVVVVEKEYKNSPDDMETITMWAELSSKATNAQQNAAPDTHVRNAILSIDIAKIRKDAEDAIEEDENLKEKTSFRVVKDKNGNKSLVGLHNISEDKLKKAIKQGGLANPSMAVIDMDKQSHVDYGDITLVAPSSLIDKKTGKNIGTYTADAWTPIYPQVEKQMSKPGAKEYSKDLEQVPSELRSKVRLYFNAYLEDGSTSGALNYWFLHDTGKNPPLLTSQSNDYTNEELDAIEAISNAGYYSGLNEEEKQKVLELFIEKQGGKDVFEKNIADRIETMKKNLQRPDIKSFIKKKVEQTLQGIEEYGYDYEQVSNFYANAQRAINNRGKIDEFRTFRNAQDIVNNEGLQGEFDKWLSEKEEQFGVEEYIFVGYNNNGDRKYIPNTLENASRIMKKEGRAGATGLYGFNHFVATLAPNAGSLVQIRKKKGNLSSQEEYKAFVDKWGSVYHDLAEVLRGDYDGYSDVGYYRLEEMPTVKNPKEYVKKEYGIDLSDEFMQKYNDFVSAIKNDFPARYFETKFERPVYLNEFAAAVVPSDMGLDLYGQLLRMGIPMYEYERGNNEARMAAVDKVTIDNEGVRFRVSNRNQEIFVSNAQRAVEGIKQEKATPQQWLAMIEKNSGMKAGEDKWLGLSYWLKGLDKKSVTKEEILDFINQNKIRIEEVQYTEDGEDIVTYEDLPARNTRVEDWNHYGKETGHFGDFWASDKLGGVNGKIFISRKELRAEKRNVYVPLIRDRYLQNLDSAYPIYYDTFEGAVDGLNKYFDNHREKKVHRVQTEEINSTRLEYTTQGLENNAEIALIVPTIESWNEDDEIHFGDAGEGRAIAWIRFGETRGVVNETESVDKYLSEMRSKYNTAEGEEVDYMSEDEIKHLQSLTSSEIEAKDNAPRILVIDEIQSKRHQEGREKGYMPIGVRNVQVRIQNIEERLEELGRIESASDYGLTDEQLDEQAALLAEERELVKSGTIPAAPFEKNWPELAFKRMLRYAAENGFDKVAWTTGAQQAERYSLSNVVDSISISKSKKVDGKYHITSWDKDTMPIGIASGNKSAEELKELFGKAIADELINGVENLEEGSDTFVLEGADLEVGGEGMKGFYDKMLPSFVNKYVKKWGAKVQDIELPNVEESGRIMHSVDVTEAMKESVMEGQTMFRVSSQKRREISKAVADYTSKYSSQPVYLVDDSMSDLEKFNLFDRLVKLSEINNWIREKKAKACLLRDNGKIYIFADNISPDDVELSMFHENLHAYIADYSELMDKVWERMKDIPSERLTHIKAKYKEEKWKEEFFVYTISLAQKVGYLGEVKPHLDEAEMNELIGLLNKYGYDYEKEYDERRRARASKLDGQGRSEDRGRVRTTGSGTEGLLRESGQEERKARLNELFNQVADMGLQGVLGNKEYTSLMVDIYKALPEEVRAEIAEDALRLYGGSVAPAVSDYIGPKSKNSIMDKVVTIVREALRKVGFDLDLNANEVRYMAWRSKKPLDRNNMFEVAEDIDMKYRLKVGEYDGTTPDGGGTRFRRVFHGSGASFDKFDHSFMGTGEGNQSFGWGTYVTDVEGIGKQYANIYAKNSPLAANTLRWLEENGTYEDFITKGEGKRRNYSIRASREYLKELREDGKPQDIIEAYEADLKDAEEALTEESYNKTKENMVASLNRNLYEVEIPDNDGTNYIAWDKMLPKEQAERIKKAVRESDFFKAYEKEYGSLAEERLDAWTKTNGGRVYKLLGNFTWMDTGADKAISQLLSKAGFVGFEYPANYLSGGNNFGQNNYVIFDENDLEIKEHTRFRVSNKLQVRDEYEATIKKGGYQAREAVQDAMLSLRKFQELIEKASGKKIRDFENAWMHENRLSSVVQAEIHDMERKFYKPMMDAVKKLMSAANLEQEQVADYLMLKHGIERNREMAVRKALTDDKGKIDRTRLEQWYQDKRNVRNRAATPHLDTWKKQQEELDNIALLYGADMSRDYSGLTSMFDTDDLADSTQKAYDEVEALENAHPVETESLGKAVKAMTQNTLDKSFESGLMDRKVYDELSKDMYDYYIPLRGFEETTSEEVYAYLDQDRGAFNAPLKRAKGRSSKSDNPIAYLKSIAESGIMQGNRNKMKQSFLNMVINHPSDLVSVREGVWVIYNPASGEWEAASAPAIPNNATPADVEAAMEAWEQQMEQAAQNDPNIKKVSEAADVPYRVVGNRMDQHQIIVKRLGKSYTLTINGNPRLAMAINGQTNPNNTSNDGKVAAFVNNKIGALNRSLAAWYTTRNPDFVASNFMRDTFYTNTIVRAKEGNAYANKFHKNYATVLPKMLGLFRKYENGTLNPADQTDAAFLDFMMNGGETGYSNLKDVEEIKKQISKELKGNRFGKVEALAEKLDILNRAVENTARFAAFLTSREEGRSIAKSVFDAKEISVNFNKKGAGGTFFGMTGQTWFGNLASMVGASGRALYVFFNAAIQGTTNLMHVMKVNPKGTSAGLAAMFLMGAVIPFLFDDDDEKDYYDLPEHVRRNHLIIPGTNDAWISIPLPIEYRIMYGMGELLTSWRTGHERGSDIGRKMLNLTGQALPLNFLEEGFDAFIPSALSPVWQVYNNRSWTGLPIYKDNEFNKDDPEYTKAYKNVDRGIYEFTKALYNWTFDEENQKERIDLNPAVIEALARGYFGGLATQLSNIGKTAEIVAGEREFDWRSIPIGNRLFKSGDERTKEKRVTNEYFENMEKLDFLQSRERMLKKTEKGVAVPEADKFKAQKDLETMQGTEVYKKYQEFKKQKKVVDKIRKTIKEKGSTPEREKQLMEAQEKANKSVR